MAIGTTQCRAWADRVTWACEQVSKEIESENIPSVTVRVSCTFLMTRCATNSMYLPPKRRRVKERKVEDRI